MADNAENTQEVQNVQNEPAAQDENPFSGFESEEFSHGERVADPAPPEENEEEETEAPEDREEERGEEDAEAEEEGAEEGREEESRPRKKSARERINELTAARREAERRAEALERELAQLRAAPPAPQDEPNNEPAGEAREGASEDDPPRPSPDDFEYGELDSRYIEALVEWRTDRALAQRMKVEEERRQQEAKQRAQQEAQQKLAERIKAGAKKHEDFYERVVIGAEQGTWPLSEHLGTLIVESSVGDDIAYHLATHPEEALSVYRQSPLEQARYFGRMEAKFSASQGAARGKEPEPPARIRTPQAPPPVEPARGTNGKFQATASSDDFAAFERAAMGGK